MIQRGHVLEITRVSMKRSLKRGQCCVKKEAVARRTRWSHTQRFTAIPRAPSFALFLSSSLSLPRRAIADRVAFSLSNPFLTLHTILKLNHRYTTRITLSHPTSFQVSTLLRKRERKREEKSNVKFR